MPSCCFWLSSFCKNQVFEEGILSGETDLSDPDLEKPIIEIFQARLQQKKICAKKTALQFTERAVLSYSQFNGMASCLAKCLVERLGYDYKIENPDGDLVIAICLPTSEKAVALIFAIFKIGAVYLPIDPTCTEEKLHNLLTQVKPVLLITDNNSHIFNKYDLQDVTSLCKVISIEEMYVDIDFALETKSRRPSIDVAWEIDYLDSKTNTPMYLRPAVIFFSGGANNVCTRWSHKCITNFVSYHWRKLKLTPEDSCCVTVSLASPISVPQIVIPLLLGCTLHLFKRQEIEDTHNFIKNLSWRSIARLSFPTRHLDDMLNAIESLGKEQVVQTLKNLKIVICRGGLLTSVQAGKFFEAFTTGVKLCNATGSIETAGEIVFEVYTSLSDFIGKMVDNRPALGRIVDNVKLYILDNQMQLTRDGEEGDVYVAGNCLAIGYVSSSDEVKDEQSQAFVPNPHSNLSTYNQLFKTGERGRLINTKNGRRLLLEERGQNLKDAQSVKAFENVHRKTQYFFNSGTWLDFTPVPHEDG